MHRFTCKTGDDTTMLIEEYRGDEGYGVLVWLGQVRFGSLNFLAGPATADAIASALHVAAAQVRAARGEKAPELTYDARIILNRVDGKDLDVEDVRRIARDLNAWLAAHEAGK